MRLVNVVHMTNKVLMGLWIHQWKLKMSARCTSTYSASAVVTLSKLLSVFIVDF